MPETPSQPKDPRLIDAEIAQAQANARKAVAEASAAEASGLVPDLPKEATAGDLAVPDAPAPLATVAAYRAVGEVGSMIAARLPGTGAVWIVPDGGFQQAIDTHDALAAQVERLIRLVKGAVPALAAVSEAGIGTPQPRHRAGTGPATQERALPGALAAELLASAAPLVMSLFSTSRTVTSAEVSIAFTTAAAAVAAAAKTRVYVWGITPPPAAELEASIQDLQDARDELDRALVDARSTSAPTSAEAIATAEAEAWKVALVEVVKKSDAATIADIVDRIARAVGRATEERNRNAHHGHVIASCEQLLTIVDEVLLQVSGSTGAALAAQSALGAALKDAHVLVLQPTYTGAESTYENVKLRRARALHVGSSVIAWYLLDKDKGLEQDAPLVAGIQWAHRSATTKVGLPDVTWAPPATASPDGPGRG